MYTKDLDSAVHSITSAKIRAYLSLFSVAPYDAEICHRTIPASVLMRYGILFLDKNGRLVVDQVPHDHAKIAIDLFAGNTEQFNQTFFGSFRTVSNIPIEELLLHQFLHYITAYLRDHDGRTPIYVPVTAANDKRHTFVPADDTRRLMCVQLLDPEDCGKRLDNLLVTITAPSNPQLESIFTLFEDVGIVDLDKIKSYEIMAAYADFSKVMPQTPTTALRLALYKTTGQTLLIKNEAEINSIKRAAYGSGDAAYKILSALPAEKYAEIFFRYKPIFLAFKSHEGCAPVVNAIRRKADKFHRPLPRIAVQNFTQVDADMRQTILRKASNREIIKLFNALSVKSSRERRTGWEDPAPAVYQVRNGKAFVKETSEPEWGGYKTLKMFSEVLDEIKNRYEGTLKGKTFYYPPEVNYPVPTSEKQTIGHFPWGTSISAVNQNAFIIGIHWLNNLLGGEEERTDIDLHLRGATSSYGWNGNFKNLDERTKIIYTGDQINAPRPTGAAEAFWIEGATEPLAVIVNSYTALDKSGFKIYFANPKTDFLNRDYCYDPAEVIGYPLSLTFPPASHTMTIGILKDKALYLHGGNIGGGIVPRGSFGDYIKGVTAKLVDQLSLRTLLRVCGATVISDLEMVSAEQRESIISLAPEDLTVNTLFDIVDGKV